MPAQALKAMWTVQAGLHQEHIIPEYTKQWFYTSEDFEADRAIPPDHPTKFSNLDELVHTYARSITNPAYVNYVRVEFLWV